MDFSFSFRRLKTNGRRNWQQFQLLHSTVVQLLEHRYRLVHRAPGAYDKEGIVWLA